MHRRRRDRCPQVARWVRMDVCKSCAEFGAVPRLRSGLVPSLCPLAVCKCIVSWGSKNAHPGF